MRQGKRKRAYNSSDKVVAAFRRILFDGNAADHAIPIMVRASQIVRAGLVRGQVHIFHIARL
jgi:hypothetical protein